MKWVYTTATPPQAHLVRGYLEGAGIAALVRGEELFTVRGGVPLGPESDPSVWVRDEDYEQARALVEEFLCARAVEAGATLWRCPSCGEYLEPQFTECWQCGASRG